MFVMDGIAYAGEPTEDIKVSAARVTCELCMLVTFSTGETRLFDATPLLSMPVFEPLANPDVFTGSMIDHGILTWLGGAIDIGTDYVYSSSYPYEAAA